MHKFPAPTFVVLARYLGDLQQLIDSPSPQWNALSGEPKPDHAGRMTKSFLVGLKRACEDADLPISAELIDHHISNPPTTSEGVQILFNCVLTEMKQRVFFRMPQDKVQYWNNISLLGDAAKKAFGEQATILETAATCYSYGLPASCVFHSMQAVETGIRIVASRLGAKIIGRENMRTVIEAIERGAKAVEQLPNKAHPDKAADSQFYGEIATNASNFKNAWRNYVAHGKAPYTEQQALDVLRDVCRFFNKLAERHSSDEL